MARRPQDITGLERARLVVEASSLSGEARGAFLREHGLREAQLDAWTRALEGRTEAAPPSTAKADAKRIKQPEKEIARKDKALAETAALLVLKKSGAVLRGKRGRRHAQEERAMTLALVHEAVSAGAGFTRSCEELGFSARTVQRWRSSPQGKDKRCGPSRVASHALSAEEWAEVRALATAPEFTDLSPHRLVAKLADMGIYVASESSFYREPRRAKLLAHRDRSRPRKQKKPVERVVTGPGQAWAWDITYLPGAVVGTYYFLYAVLDVWSRKLVAWEVHDEQTDELSAPLVAAACAREGVLPGELLLHADNGGAVKGKIMLAKLEELGVMPSFSRPRVSDDNPFPDAFFRTLKCRPSYPDGRFVCIEQARQWVERFVHWYNDDHQHSGIRFVTPSQRHDGRERAILNRRHDVYQAARARHPGR